MNSIADYIKNNSKLEPCTKYLGNVSKGILSEQCTVQKYRYAQTIKTTYLRPLVLYCANICTTKTEDNYGVLYDCSKCFEQLYNIKHKSLTDSLIYNVFSNNFKIVKLPQLSYDEAKDLIDRHIQLINEFNAYYDEVQLINKIEAI